jgi:hypothetical protein
LLPTDARRDFANAGCERGSFGDRVWAVVVGAAARVAVFVGDGGNAGGPAAAIDLDQGPNLAADPVVEANRERVMAIDDRTAARVTGETLSSEHGVVSCVCPNKDCQFCLLKPYP